MDSKRAKHIHIVRVLRSRIVRGKYQGRLPGLRALAEEFGVNLKTVQMALLRLEGTGMVRTLSRQRSFVLPPAEVSRDPGSLYARLVLPLPNNTDSAGNSGLWSGVIYSFQRAAQAHNLTMALEYSSDVDHVVNQAIREARTPGCVGTCILETALETRHVVRLAEAAGPVVIAEWELADMVLPSVCFDNVGAGGMVAQHLFELGHRRIAYVCYPTNDQGHAHRLRGVEEVLDGVGVGLSAKLIYEGRGRPAIKDMLCGGRAPTAVICGGGTFDAIGIIERAAALGKRVPEDLSVVAMSGPLPLRRRITMCVMDQQALGVRALEMLLEEDLLSHPRRELVPVRLLEGGTTAPPRAG